MSSAIELIASSYVRLKDRVSLEKCVNTGASFCRKAGFDLRGASG